MIESRLAKAQYELEFAPKFDVIIINDELEKAQVEAYKMVQQFINNNYTNSTN